MKLSLANSRTQSSTALDKTKMLASLVSKLVKKNSTQEKREPPVEAEVVAVAEVAVAAEAEVVNPDLLKVTDKPRDNP